MVFRFICLCFLLCLSNCFSKKETFWIYTSLYKDTIADIKPRLEKKFPNIDFQFYQAGSEEVAAKVNAELLAGGAQADLVISSDRFWHEEMAQENYLEAYSPQGTQSIPQEYKSEKDYYHSYSLPVMVIVANKKQTEFLKPKTFAELTEPQWKNKIVTGSPLSSGTMFTTLVFLQRKYGNDYFEKLQKNGTISEGGNSAVLRRIQSGERAVGVILLENLLRFHNQKTAFETIYPEDGVVVQNNVLSILKKTNPHAKRKEIVDWFFSKEGQQSAVRSMMYSPQPNGPAPLGARPLSQMNTSSFPWDQNFLKEIVEKREDIKEKMTDALFL